MRSSWTLLNRLCLLLSILSSSQSQKHDFLDSLHSHHHSETDLDVVQCHNAVYKINEKNGKPELVNGEESRADPSRQYLPPPGKYLPPESPKKSATPPKGEEDPAASFDQPNFLSVEKTLLSPSLQKNYQSLFVKNSNPDHPTAAQNVAPNILIPPAPRKTSSDKDSEDDKYSLDRLCKDAFHSFLCKPIKGPRKTPNGRIRPNAVLPPDVLAGLPSFQDIAKVRPDPPPLPSTTKYSPFQQSPTNQNQQRLPFPTPATPKPVFATTPTKEPTAKPYNKPDIPDFPSPSNNNPQILKPQPSENIPLNTAAQTNGYVYQKPLIPFPPPVSSPSDQNSQLIYQRPTFPTTTFPPSTPKPTTTLGYSYDRPNIPFSSNNVLQIAAPPQSNSLPSSHDCENHKSANSPVEANPSNNNPSFIKPYNQVASKPLFLPKQPIEKPVYPLSSNDFPRVSLFPQTTTKKPSYSTTTEECDKHKSPYPSLFGSSTNENRVLSKPANNKPVFPQPSNNIVSFSSLPSTITAATEDCDKHKANSNNPIFGNPTNQNPTFVKPSYDKPISPFPTKPFPSYYAPQKQTEQKPKEDCDKHKPSFQPDFANPTNQHSVVAKPLTPRNQPQLPKLPASSNNIAQILAEPQPIQSVTASSNTDKGYFYDKPAIQFPPPEGYPSDGDPNVIAIPTKKPFTFPTTTEKQNGYIYEQPRIPFASDSIEQILPQPTKSTPKSPSTTKVPCEHDKPFSPSQQFLGNPSNQDSIAIRPSNSYGSSYSESARPSNQFPSGFRPFVPSTKKPNNGYSYDKPPNPTNNAPSFASNGYSFQTTRKPYPSPFKQFSTTTKPLSAYPYYQQSEQSLDAKPQNQVEVAVQPGYSYDKPSNPLEPSATNDGYSYPRPANPFIR